MPLPPVAVEVVPPLEKSELVSTLLQACSQAVVETDCVKSGSEPPGERPSAVAIVTVEGDRVRVEVGVQRSGESQWLTRDLRFGAMDPEYERFKTVGFVIGTLAGEISEELTQTGGSEPGLGGFDGGLAGGNEDVSEEPEEVEGVELDEDHFETPSAPVPWNRHLWFDLGFVTGPGLKEGAWRVGAEARISAGLAGQLFGFAGGGFARRAQDEQSIAMTWAPGFVGLGGGLAEQGAFGIDARAAFQVVRVDAQISNADGVDAEGRFIPGARLAADLHYRFSDYLGAELSAEGCWLSKGYDIRVGSDRRLVASLPRLGFQFGAGLRLWP